MEKRVLITSAIFEETKRPVLFLGNWCVNNLNKSKWSKMNYEVNHTEIFNYENSQKIVQKSKVIYESVLSDLTKALNDFHNLNWKKKTWRIIIGPWLFRFVSVFYKNIELINDLKEKCDVTIDDEISLNKKVFLTTSDLWDFTEKIYHDNYNKYLASIAVSKIFKKDQIYESYKIYDESINTQFSHLKITKLSFLTKIINIFFKFIERIFCFKNKIIFYKIYYGNIFSLIKIFFKLKEFPFKYNLKEERKIFKLNYSKRKSLILKSSDDFNEQIIRDFIIQALPTIYLEGFSETIKMSKSGIFPKKRDLIYSCNIQYDYMFKFWAAQQIDQGSKLIYGQHGAGYDFFENDHNIDHETEISELFLSWGWEHSNKKVRSVGCSFLDGKKNLKEIKNNKFLLVLTENYHHFKHNDIFYLNDIYQGKTNFVSKSTETIFRFLESNQKKSFDLTVRVHPKDKRQPVPYKILFEKNFRNIKYDQNKDIMNSFDNYELIIFSSLVQTSFFHCIGLNKPCIVLTTFDLNSINPKYQSLCKDLILLKVFHTSAESMTSFLNNDFKDLQSWWNNPKVREAVKRFKNIHLNHNSISSNLISALQSNKLFL
jgi:putative transferase (TIGR04331 family)